jgi:diketogulonate reductase-like aldo/keto reductase
MFLAKRQKLSPASSMSNNNFFQEKNHASQARSLMDGVRLATPRSEQNVIMPYVGYGTYRLGKTHSFSATLEALQVGYRSIDTAFIYGGETTEEAVGRAIQQALKVRVLSDRKELFVTTKHWRKYHGYEETKKCLRLSLKRLNLDYVDLYLIHWPGSPYTTMNRRKDMIEEHGPWYYAKIQEEDMPHARAETWRAMEDLQQEGKIKAIGVSNFTIQHLETLKKTARAWPPAVNQVECHPLYPQDELRAYCEREGIVLQAYAALGGQDGTKKQWTALLGGPKMTLRTCPTVEEIAAKVNRNPAQVLLRYALQRNCAVVPKTTSRDRMVQNAAVFDFSLSDEQMHALDELEAPEQKGRLCWRTDPLRLLDFD